MDRKDALANVAMEMMMVVCRLRSGLDAGSLVARRLPRQFDRPDGGFLDEAFQLAIHRRETQTRQIPGSVFADFHRAQ